MNRKLGSRNGKNNRRLFFLNKKKKINIENLEYEEIKKKEELEKKTKEQQLININQSINISQQETILKNDNIEQKKAFDFTEQNKQIIEKKPLKKGKTIVNQSDILLPNDFTEKKQDNISDIPLTVPFQEKEIDTSTDIFTEQNNVYDFKKDINDNVSTLEEEQQEITKTGINRLEKQIINVLENKIDEDKYELKKIDNEIYGIKKILDSIYNNDEIEEVEKRIEILVERINDIKRKIDSLRKTFDIDFPVDQPDNYLINLVEEYQDKGKLEQELSEKLKQNQEFKALIDEIIEIERNNDDLKQQIQVKKENYLIDDEQVKKITDDIVSIDDIKNKITQMLETQTKLLDEIKQKVNETVHINERISIISKTVNHSLLDLFLLMAIFKHNLSIKNNLLAAITTKIALDMIIKMTTPVEEKITIRENDLVDYQSLITNCLDNTSNLENLIDSNLNDINSIRYIFEHDYKDCSYLDSYQEALSKLLSLESEMKDRKKDIINMKYEAQFQLEKNNEKVRKYILEGTK